MMGMWTLKLYREFFVVLFRSPPFPPPTEQSAVEIVRLSPRNRIQRSWGKGNKRMTSLEDHPPSTAPHSVEFQNYSSVQDLLYFNDTRRSFFYLRIFVKYISTIQYLERFYLQSITIALPTKILWYQSSSITEDCSVVH